MGQKENDCGQEEQLGHIKALRRGAAGARSSGPLTVT
jgi:hypothetical protein